MCSLTFNVRPKAASALELNPRAQHSFPKPPPSCPLTDLFCNLKLLWQLYAHAHLLKSTFSFSPPKTLHQLHPITPVIHRDCRYNILLRGVSYILSSPFLAMRAHSIQQMPPTAMQHYLTASQKIAIKMTKKLIQHCYKSVLTRTYNRILHEGRVHCRTVAVDCIIFR